MHALTTIDINHTQIQSYVHMQIRILTLELRHAAPELLLMQKRDVLVGGSGSGAIVGGNCGGGNSNSTNNLNGINKGMR